MTGPALAIGPSPITWHFSFISGLPGIVRSSPCLLIETRQGAISYKNTAGPLLKVLTRN